MGEMLTPELDALEMEARQLWNERQEDCAKYGADIPLPKVEVRVDMLCHLIATARLALATSPLPSGEGVPAGWQPIETAPKGGIQFLAYARMDVLKGSSFLPAEWLGLARWTAWPPHPPSLEWGASFGPLPKFITHWQPLPAPPGAPQ